MVHKVIDFEAREIDYRLNILGIRVGADHCQLVAKDGGGAEWITIGPRVSLPVSVPRSTEGLKAASTDALRVTAYQYINLCPGSDLLETLKQTKDFDDALATPAADEHCED